MMLILLASCQKKETQEERSRETASTGLTATEAAAARTRLLEEWRTAQQERLHGNMVARAIEQDGLRMKYSYKRFGEKPQGGWALWISLHGGGGTTHEANEQQWRNQQTLYKPKDCYYVCPRAPWDEWDMWFKAPIDSLFEELIQTMVAEYDVDPDKVYVMGYSAGGDGVWRLAPRLADHWASAAMMAGHPGDVQLANVRNMPFTLWVGEHDDAYNRNGEVAARGRELDSLQQLDPEGYVHDCHVVAGKGHWMDQEDTAAVGWMEQYRRNPYPKRIVWRQEEVTRATFYWLRVPREEMAKGQRVAATIRGNVIEIEECDYSRLTLMLNDELVDLDQPVTIEYKGRVLLEKRLQRSEETMRRTLYERNDPRYIFDSEVTVEVAAK